MFSQRGAGGDGDADENGCGTNVLGAGDADAFAEVQADIPADISYGQREFVRLPLNKALGSCGKDICHLLRLWRGNDLDRGPELLRRIGGSDRCIAQPWLRISSYLDHYPRHFGTQDRERSNRNAAAEIDLG